VQFQECLFRDQGCMVSCPPKNSSQYLCRTTAKEAILACAHAWKKWYLGKRGLDARFHRGCLAKFFTNKPSAECYTEVCDSALNELLVQMSFDVARIWNSIAELYNPYSELGGTKLSRHSLIKIIYDHFYPNLLVLSSRGVASILVFKVKHRIIFRPTPIMPAWFGA